MYNLILIPARAGSTRVNNKNLRLLGDKPLIAYAIESAIASGAGRVIVTTNSDAIAAEARKWGAEVPFLRPDDLSTATASSLSAIVHAVDWLRRNENWIPELLAFCPPTNPFRSALTIKNMIGKLAGSDTVNSIVTITKPATHPFK